MQYDKPHLTIEQQLRQLSERGLQIDEGDAARRILETVGYYRFSAYAYPFRRPIPKDVAPDTSVQFRVNSFEVGARFDWARSLWAFDRSLRLHILDAVEAVEIALRSKIGYHLGRRDPFGHLDRTSLDTARCARLDIEFSDRGVFDVWLDRFAHHQKKAQAEDFVQHYVEKYDSKLPVWVATEVMEFGQLVRLFGLMRDDDQSLVSKDIAQVSGAVFGRWMKVANYTRNLSAHHARLWNRRLTYKVGRIPDNAADLIHLNEAPESRQRIYAACVVLAFLVRAIRPEARWAARLVELLDTFPNDLPVSPERNMGFPAGWRSLEVWSTGAA
ncbi:Abi family protein [Leifsonia shinshuensis]|uniref:Abi family protein n=1 Tax=Leifsonia shinshuensis TaxID=150026 RepID=A0A7G6YEM1_9MICO|nr:Abi family protein [Leifsonia shinshuensis]QNE36936.1 Abi family protein [Leifsonia shinshuensis]